MAKRNFGEEISKDALITLIDSYEAMVQNRENHFFEVGSFYQIIEFYEESFEYKKALEVTEWAVAQYPFSAVFHLKKAQFLYEARDCVSALEVLEKAEILDPSDLEILYLKAEMHIHLEKHEEALEILQQAFDKADSDEFPDIFLLIADVYEDLDDWTTVFDYLEQALLLENEHSEALNRLLYCVEVGQMYERSISFHKSLLEEAPFCFRAWYNLANSYYSMKMYSKSIDSYEFAIAIKEDFEQAYRECAEAYSDMENYEKALEYFEEAAEVGVEDEELWCSIARCHLHLGKDSYAISALKKAISIDRKCEEAHFLLGNIYQEMGSYIKASSYYDTAIKIDDSNPEYLSVAADLHYYLDDYIKSVDLYRKAIEEDKHEIEYWIGLLKCYFDLHMFDDCLEIIDRGFEIFEVSSELFYLKACVFMATGKKYQAMECLTVGLEIDCSTHSLIFDLLPHLEENVDICDLIDQKIVRDEF